MSRCYSVRVMAVPGMVTPTQRHRPASRMTAKTRRNSSPTFLRPAHCKPTSLFFVPPPTVVMRSLRVANSVTVVGGTVSIPEVAVNFSGGGFSNYVRLHLSIMSSAYLTATTQFPRPAWQNVAVTKFLDSLPSHTYAGLFNPHGRVRGSLSIYEPDA